MASSHASLELPPPNQGTSLVDRINISIHFRRYFKIISRRWWIPFLLVLVGTGIALYVALTTPNKYRAYSTLGFTSRVETGVGGKAQVVELADGFVEHQLVLMKSPRVRNKAQEYMREIDAALGVHPELESSVSKGAGSLFMMTVDSTDLRYASLYVSNWARAFVAYKNEVNTELIEKKFGQTRQEVKRYEQNLEKARESTLIFKKKHNIGDIRDAGLAAQDRLNRLTAELDEIVLVRKRLESYTKDELLEGKMPEILSKNPAKDAASAVTAGPDKSKTADPLAPFRQNSYTEHKLNLKAREAEYFRYQATLKPKHPFLVSLQNEIQRTRQELQFQLDNIEERRRAEIEKLRKDEIGLRPRVEEMRREVFEKSTVLNEFEKLKKEEDYLEKELDRQKRSLLALESTPTNEETISTVEEGVGLEKPVGPNRPKIILLGLLLGLFSGIGIVYVLYRLDDRLDLAEDIEESLQEPVLGQIPAVDRKNHADGPLLANRLEPNSLFAESIRGVRSAVMFGTQSKKKQVMVITSALPGDGKTTFSVNFASTLANAGLKVLLIDSDLRRGTVSNYFNQPRTPGFSEVLAGDRPWQQSVRETPIPTLHLLTTGQLIANPGELLMGEVAHKVISEARQFYDHVIIDCPPITAIDDTFCLIPITDGLLFVVKSGQTSMRFAKSALGALRHRGAEILGVVLNGITSDNPHYYYNNYYHAYYGKQAQHAATAPTPIPAAVHRATPPNRPITLAVATAVPPKSAQDFKLRRATQRKANLTLPGATAARPARDVTVTRT
ncbi:chain-length determining protein [Verrucomicrobiota bacterium]|nr:chain-length determining protein [Verrucomicrobiota bacterium]